MKSLFLICALLIPIASWAEPTGCQAKEICALNEVNMELPIRKCLGVDSRFLFKTIAFAVYNNSHNCIRKLMSVDASTWSTRRPFITWELNSSQGSVLNDVDYARSPKGITQKEIGAKAFLSDNNFTLLSHAAFLHNINMMKRLLNMNVVSRQFMDVNAVQNNDHGFALSAMGMAALFNRVDSMKFLQANGASLNPVANEIPAITMALYGKSREALVWLLAQGVDVNVPRNGSSERFHNTFEQSDRPLITAEKMSHEDVSFSEFAVQLLKSYGAQ